jgi:hypothetical protein
MNTLKDYFVSEFFLDGEFLLYILICFKRFLFLD